MHRTTSYCPDLDSGARARHRRLRSATSRSRAPCSTRRCAPSGRPRRFPAADEDYFHDMDGALPLTKEQIQGRNMWIVWTGGNDRLWDVLSPREPRLARLPEDAVVAPDAAVLARHPLELPRPRQRAVLHEGRPAPIRTATGCGSTCATRACGPDPFANADKYQGRPDRRARQDGAGRLLLRRAHRRRRPAAVPESGLRRGRAQEVGLGAVLSRPELLRVAQPGASRTASACRARSATSGRTR